MITGYQCFSLNIKYLSKISLSTSIHNTSSDTRATFLPCLYFSLLIVFLILQLKNPPPYFPTVQLLKMWYHLGFLVKIALYFLGFDAVFCVLLSHVLPFAQGLGLYVPRFTVAFLDFD